MIRCSRKAMAFVSVLGDFESILIAFTLFILSHAYIYHVHVFWYIAHIHSSRVLLTLCLFLCSFLSDRFIVNSHTLNMKYAAGMYKCGKINDSIRIIRSLPQSPTSENSSRNHIVYSRFQFYYAIVCEC